MKVYDYLSFCQLKEKENFETVKYVSDFNYWIWRMGFKKEVDFWLKPFSYALIIYYFRDWQSSKDLTFFINPNIDIQKIEVLPNHIRITNYNNRRIIAPTPIILNEFLELCSIMGVKLETRGDN
jgi:hypothetical protein